MTEPARDRDEAIDKALLYTFQLSGKDYRKMQAALSAVAFVRALEQDGFTVAARDSGQAETLRDFLDEIETLCEDNGQNAILVEDLQALVRVLRAALAAANPPESARDEPECECGEPQSAGIHDPIRTWVRDPNKLHAFRAALAVPGDDALRTALRLLLPTIESSGIPHEGHNQACHDADALMVRSTLDALASPAAASEPEDDTLLERIATALFDLRWWEKAIVAGLSTGELAHDLAARLAPPPSPADPAEGLDVERLRDAMYDADSGCSGIPGECCAPSTHADAEAIAAAYLAADEPTEADRLATYEAALASGLSDAEAREEGWPR